MSRRTVSSIRYLSAKWHLLTCLCLVLLYKPTAGYSQDMYDITIQPADATAAHYVPLLKHKRVALVINQTSKVGDESLLDILLIRNIDVVKIFVPEHGFRGHDDAGASIENTVDSATHLPVISLYGTHKKPKPEDLADIDIVVYDLQDVGVRFYTYISTLEYCMEACAENHKQFMILDRPNPNGFYVDGPILEAENRSFVGMQPIPIVYGMTAGEYAQMLVGERWLSHAEDVDLKVIKCLNYDHTKKYKLPEDYIFYIGNTDPKKNMYNTFMAYAKYVDGAEHPLPLLVADVDQKNLDIVIERAGLQEYSKYIQLTGYIYNTDLPFILVSACQMGQ